jgi:hypothetical protein
MYTIILDEGIVLRDIDQKVVSPCQSSEDVDFLSYQEWVNSGNEPAIYNTRSEIPNEPD